MKMICEHIYEAVQKIEDWSSENHRDEVRAMDREIESNGKLDENKKYGCYGCQMVRAIVEEKMDWNASLHCHIVGQPESSCYVERTIDMKKLKDKLKKISKKNQDKFMFYLLKGCC
jgi:hypothetical protein